MSTMISMSHDDSIHEIIKMVNDVPNKLSIFQLIRVSRIRLGCALERLDNFDPAPKALEQLHHHVEILTSEIDALLRSIQQMTGR